jgi:asparagine synthase (glutamine-hydrolysing)
MSGIAGFLGPHGHPPLEWLARVLAHRQIRARVAIHEGNPTLGYSASKEVQFWENGKRFVLLDGYLLQQPAFEPESFFQTWQGRSLPDAIAHLRGSFVLAAWDGERLGLARDGLGMRALYHGMLGDTLLFGSEPKCVWSAPGFSRQLRPAALAEFLTFSFIPGRRTMLEGVSELEAGHCLEWMPKSGSLGAVIRRWFTFAEQPAAPNSDPDGRWPETFASAIGKAVADRGALVPPREELGVFLSGGLDSSIITAELAAQFPGKTIHAFSIHFGKHLPNELEFARLAASRTGVRHHEVEVRPRNFINRLEEISAALDDPIGDPITVPNYLLAEHAAQRVRHLFNGEGGDPVMGGPKNMPMLLEHWYQSGPPDPLFRERAYLASYRRAYEEIESLLDPDFVRTMRETADLEGILTPFFQSDIPADFLNKLTLINIRLKGGSLILPKVERMTAPHGLTIYSPLFDENIAELSFTMPPRMKLSQGVEKYLMKKCYEQRLPPEIIHRPKSGMRVPVHSWFRDEMRGFAFSLLASRKTLSSGYFNAKRVKELLNYRLEEANPRCGLRIWMLMTFELWRRRVLQD